MLQMPLKKHVLARFVLAYALCIPFFWVNDSSAGVIESTQVGPSFSKEAQILWQKGKSAFGAGNYAAAAENFKRYLHRYPSTQHYSEAFLLLGISYLRDQKFKEAISPLKSYVEKRGFDQEGLRARISLGNAQVKVKKYHEALLTAAEIIGTSYQKTIPFTIYLSALLLKSKAYIGLDQDFKSKRNLGAFEKQIRSKPNLNLSTLKSEASFLEIWLKTRECSRLASSPTLAEQETRSLLNKRGTCLLETLTLLQPTLEIGDDRWLDDSKTLILRGIQEYYQRTQNPPRPPGKRTPIELKRYQEELVDILTQDYQEFRSKAIEITATLKRKTPEGLKYHVLEIEKQI